MIHKEKKFTLFLISIVSIFSCSYSAQAQLDKGVWLVGGSGSFYSYNQNYSISSSDFTGKYTEIDLSASIGYFFMDKFSAGLRPYFNSNQGISSGVGASLYSRFAIGPFVRYYFLNPDRQFNILTDVSYQIGTSNLFYEKKNGKLNTLSIMAGVELFFNSTIGMEILAGYRNRLESNDNGPEKPHSNRKGLQVSIGFQFHLEKK